MSGSLYRELRELRFDLKALIETRAGHDLTGCNNTVSETVDMYTADVITGEDKYSSQVGLTQSVNWLMELTYRNDVAMDDIYRRLEAIEARMQEEGR